MIRILILLLASWGFTFQCFALDLDPDEIRGTSSKKNVSVLQNRYFLKKYRPEFGFLVGSMLNEAYTDTKSYGLRFAMFANEWLGFEVQSQRTLVSDTADREALNKKRYYRIPEGEGNAAPANDLTVVSPDPEVNPIKAMNDFTVIAAPFYGKLNLVNELIIYTDLYLTSGIATVETAQGNKFAFTIGGGERFYIGKAWSVRIDIKDRTYVETRGGEESRKHALGVDLGGSYFFN
jgi:outer membrane beta-barrel protein